jgi:hypothetical protein
MNLDKPVKIVPPVPVAQLEHPSVMQELLEAIRMAKDEGQSCEVVTDYDLALKALKALKYVTHPYKKGILLQFENKSKKSQIYVHGP